MTDDIVAQLRDQDILCDEAADEIERLRAAFREIGEVYAGSEGIPQPITAAEGYLLQLLMEMVGIARAALGEVSDDAAT